MTVVGYEQLQRINVLYSLLYSCIHIMDTAIKYPVPDRFFDISEFLTSRHFDAQGWASECPDVKNYKWRLNPVWHRMLCSCTHMASVGVKGLSGPNFYDIDVGYSLLTYLITAEFGSLYTGWAVRCYTVRMLPYVSVYCPLFSFSPPLRLFSPKPSLLISRLLPFFTIFSRPY